MKALRNGFLFALLLVGCTNPPKEFITMDKQVLADKIKGGWAGQTIGVTFGGPYEFRFQGSFIDDYQSLPWDPARLHHSMVNNAGLYDDLYMDLTFVEVFEKYGLNAPVDSFANAFAHADYLLWHANQAARYNLLHGMAPPASGHWLNNPHADCIDYQIESDFAGLISPGMPNTASTISDKIGHIMNYGDGWYGGVFVGAMYAHAFAQNDINKVVEDALKSIPSGSDFHRCIRDVIQWHTQYPNDWKQTWFEVQKKYTADMGCTEGIFSPYNIDAKVNAAYVVIGLLYGNGDFTRTLDITTRCGQDADCNPSTAAGVLGTMKGYNNIPEEWKRGLSDIEGMDFKYTSTSLNDVYQLGLSHALQNITAQGGDTTGEQVRIRLQQPEAVRLEKSFEDIQPAARIPLVWNEQKDSLTFSFEGVGFVLSGETAPWQSTTSYVLQAEVYIDGVLTETPDWPTNYNTRRYELCWNYQLPDSPHTVVIKIKNASAAYPISRVEAFAYRASPIK